MAIVVALAGANIAVSLLILNNTLEKYLDELLRAVRELKK